MDDAFVERTDRTRIRICALNTFGIIDEVASAIFGRTSRVAKFSKVLEQNCAVAADALEEGS
jgi:hypothetical protein